MAKKIIVYGNADCPDCVRLTEALEQAGIRYGYVDVLAGLAQLKKFLSLREEHAAAFAARRQAAGGVVGIPTVVIDDQAVYPEFKLDSDPDLRLFR